jgi:hypothetical protein
MPVMDVKLQLQFVPGVSAELIIKIFYNCRNCLNGTAKRLEVGMNVTYQTLLVL